MDPASTRQTPGTKGRGGGERVSSARGPPVPPPHPPLASSLAPPSASPSPSIWSPPPPPWLWRSADALLSPTPQVADLPLNFTLPSRTGASGYPVCLTPRLHTPPLPLSLQPSLLHYPLCPSSPFPHLPQRSPPSLLPHPPSPSLLPTSPFPTPTLTPGPTTHPISGTADPSPQHIHGRLRSQASAPPPPRLAPPLWDSACPWAISPLPSPGSGLAPQPHPPSDSPRPWLSPPGLAGSPVCLWPPRTFPLSHQKTSPNTPEPHPSGRPPALPSTPLPSPPPSAPPQTPDWLGRAPTTAPRSAGAEGRERGRA